jgi:hypothetical protein
MYGLWEDGKRIQWFTTEQYDQIINGELDYSEFFEKDESRHLTEKIRSFSNPPEFDRQIAEMKHQMRQLIKSHDIE